MLLAGALCGAAGCGKRGEALELSGTVEATDVQLGFTVPGLLAEVGVVEGQSVEAGVSLATLDQNEMRARLAEASARIETAQAQLTELQRGFRSEEVARTRAAYRAAVSRLNEAKRDFDRARRLFEKQAIPESDYTNAQLGFEQARAARDEAQKQLQLMRAGPRPEQIAAAQGQLAQAQAARQALEATLKNMTARAPFAGLVTVRHRDPGEIVPAGSPVLTVMNPDDRWVRIYLPETRLGAVRLGQPASITTDTFPGRTYAGEVTFIASQAEFTPKNVQTYEERVKLVYAVKVRVKDDPKLELKPGMPAEVFLGAPP